MDGPIIIIGPARSGTKILRDTIATHKDVACIKYDINFIWKKHNEIIEHDELNSSDATVKSKKFIRKFFTSKLKNKQLIVEKSVSNTVRVPFVDEIFPKAKYIFLYRDGRDAVESVMRQWGVAPSKKYLFMKLTSVPILEITPYLLSYAKDVLLIKIFGKNSDSYVWGVKHKNFQKDLNSMDLLNFCAAQWNRCVQKMREDWNLVKDKGVIVKYEDLVNEPAQVLSVIAEHIGLNPDGFDSSHIRKGSINRAANTMTLQEYSNLESLILPNLIALGYKTGHTV